jgi:hypothetical protein
MGTGGQCMSAVEKCQKQTIWKVCRSTGHTNAFYGLKYWLLMKEEIRRMEVSKMHLIMVRV